ncbi:hypothetical protein [Peribacillus muralis]|uniref:hypothetical protein n=1 Tax=Peribacillus muralis TaxID=264697 RepID=UPI00070B0F0F|nr:hypothetical protein [Peribacillus muralis]MCK1993950.1 hypothetical protein [Peribacillus muralis]MCK2014505.1 hypothetical protein [Peribacillus muralis]
MSNKKLRKISTSPGNSGTDENSSPENSIRDALKKLLNNLLNDNTNNSIKKPKSIKKVKKGLKNKM